MGGRLSYIVNTVLDELSCLVGGIDYNFDVLILMLNNRYSLTNLIVDSKLSNFSSNDHDIHHYRFIDFLVFFY